MKKDNRLTIVLVGSALTIIVAVILGIIFGSADASDGGKLLVLEKKYDFGTISMADGNVSHSFEIENEGDEVLKINNINTSCMCTSAVFEKDGVQSPSFGMEMHGTNPKFWSEKLNPGETATLIVTFDPNAHGPAGVGQVTRIVNIYSSDQTSKTVIRISANVIP